MLLPSMWQKYMHDLHRWIVTFRLGNCLCKELQIKCRISWSHRLRRERCCSLLRSSKGLGWSWGPFCCHSFPCSWRKLIGCLSYIAACMLRIRTCKAYIYYLKKSIHIQTLRHQYSTAANNPTLTYIAETKNQLAVYQLPPQLQRLMAIGEKLP